MKFALIGGGNVGGTLARRFQEAGLEVLVGVPDPTNAKYAHLPATNPAEAARGADAIVLATPWSATESALQALAAELDGAVLIDATNPIAADFSGLTLGHRDSGGQQVARWAPKARVVKAFNTIGFNIMANPNLGGVPTTLTVAGDDAEAKAIAMDLAARIGFAPLDVGGLERSAQTEAMAWLWIMLSLSSGRDFAFNLHRATA